MTIPPPPSDSTLGPAVTSPCIKVCVLDARNICVGCGRSIDEITQWSRLTEEQRRLVVDRAQQRRREAAS
jgi:predicted Fe-S protein YdhL (DUF1289 family)